MTGDIDFLGLIWYDVDISRRRDAPNGEIPKANLLFDYQAISS